MTVDQTAQGRRQATRLAGQWPALLRVGDQTLDVTCVGISGRGMGIIGAPRLALGTLVEAEIMLKPQTVLWVSTQVTRRGLRSGTLGLGFVDLGPDTMAALHMLLNDSEIPRQP